jgi:hypothetical protein
MREWRALELKLVIAHSARAKCVATIYNIVRRVYV